MPLWPVPNLSFMQDPAPFVPDIGLGRMLPKGDVKESAAALADTSLSQSQSDEGQNSADEGQGQDSESFDAKTYAQIWRGRATGVTRK